MKSNRVVIASNDERQLALLSYTMESLGVELMRSTDGAQALQYVLEHSPDVLVLDEHLDNQGPAQVVQALLTEQEPISTGIVLIGDPPLLPEIGDRLAVHRISKPYRLAEVKATVQEILSTCPSTTTLALPDSLPLPPEVPAAAPLALESPEAPFPPTAALSSTTNSGGVAPSAPRGTLEATTAMQIVTRIHTGRRSGVLTFYSSDQEKALWFTDGGLVFATSNVVGDRLGDRLVLDGVITDKALDFTTDEMGRTGRRQGEILVETGLLTAEELVQALQRQLRHITMDVLQWTSGEFAFADRPAPHGIEVPVEFGVANVVLAAARRFADLDYVHRFLPPYDSHLARAKTPPVDVAALDLQPWERRLLEKIIFPCTLIEMRAASEGTLPGGKVAESSVDRLAFGLLGLGYLRSRRYAGSPAQARLAAAPSQRTPEAAEPGAAGLGAAFTAFARIRKQGETGTLVVTGGAEAGAPPQRQAPRIDLYFKKGRLTGAVAADHDDRLRDILRRQGIHIGDREANVWGAVMAQLGSDADALERLRLIHREVAEQCIGAAMARHRAAVEWREELPRGQLSFDLDQHTVWLTALRQAPEAALASLAPPGTAIVQPPVPLRVSRAVAAGQLTEPDRKMIDLIRAEESLKDLSLRATRAGIPILRTLLALKELGIVDWHIPAAPASPARVAAEDQVLDAAARQAWIDEIESAHAGLANGDPFALLGVPQSADIDEIRAAYAHRSRRFHPNVVYQIRALELGPLVQELFQHLQEAFRTLSNPALRDAARKRLHAARAATAPPAPAAAAPPEPAGDAPQPVAPAGAPPSARKATGLGGQLKAMQLAGQAQRARKEGATQEAIALFRQALQADPTAEGSCFALARLMLEAGKPTADVEQVLKDGLEVIENSARLHVMLGDVYMRAKRNKEAKQSFKEALSIEPNNAEAKAALDKLRWHLLG
ncbi:MAG: DUF4388 domain-containing protein [Candidatus Schekmanbacteria bacterium]|nr:DUF4388 domain-containing protein [Candidatus Schekmanbacteria bacterium]